MAFEGLTEKLSNAFKKLRGKGRLSEQDVKDAMKEIRMALLEADVSYKVVKEFTKTVTERAIGSDVLESLTPAQMIVKIVNEELTALMGGESVKLNLSSKPPTVVMVVGLNGAGKTTNCAKLAGFMKKQNGKRRNTRTGVCKASMQSAASPRRNARNKPKKNLSLFARRMPPCGNRKKLPTAPAATCSNSCKKPSGAPKARNRHSGW